MDLAISQNPHTKEPKKLWKIIEKETAKGEDNTELDKSSMKMLKGKLTRSRVINVK